jgi:transposase InsO family protein
MDLGPRATSVKFVIRDRAGQFASSFDAVFTAEGIRILASPPQAPRANAICERIIGTLRRELLDRLLIVNKHHLRQVMTEYLLHYNDARPHRSLASSPQLKPTPARLNRSTSPSSGSAVSRSSAGSARRPALPAARARVASSLNPLLWAEQGIDIPPEASNASARAVLGPVPDSPSLAIDVELPG